MPRQRPSCRPKPQQLLQQLGEDLRLARKRRLTTNQVAERAGISRSTLYHLEKGEANSSIGTLLQVLVALKLENDLSTLAAEDELGRKLIDIELNKTLEAATPQSSVGQVSNLPGQNEILPHQHQRRR